MELRSRVLLLSFGGPEAPEQVMPFLENVTRGRGIPRERLASVAEHYLHFGGVSPINGINRALIARTARRDRPAGLLRQPQLGAVCRGHRRDHARQRDSPRGGVHHVGVGRLLQLHPVRRGHRTGPHGGRRRGAPELVKLRQYFDHPLFVEMFTEAIAAAAQTVPDGARLVFTAHSIPARGPIPLRPGPLQPAGRPTRPAGRRRRRAMTTTTRCGSRARGRRRCRGWNPMSPTT